MVWQFMVSIYRSVKFSGMRIKGQDMKRVTIGANYPSQPLYKVMLGVPLIYIPLITTVPSGSTTSSCWNPHA